MVSSNQSNNNFAREREREKKIIYADLIQKLEKHKLSYNLTAWPAIMNLFKFISGSIFINHDELFVGSGYYFSVLCVCASCLLTMQNFRIVISCYDVLRHRRHNNLVIDYVDLAEQAFSNEDEPADLMFRLRCSAITRFLVKMLLIVFCVTNSYMIFEAITRMLDQFVSNTTIPTRMMESSCIVILLFLLCIPDVLRHISYIALAGNILFLLSLGMAFKCPLDYQFGVEPMRDFWNFKIWPMTVFVVPLLTQVTVFVIPLRFEMESSTHLTKPPYMVDFCLWTLALILCVVSYFFYGWYADEFQRFPNNCMRRERPYGIIVMTTYALSELLTIPLYVHILAATMHKFRFHRRASFLMKNFKRSGFLIAFIFFDLTPQGITFSNYLANVSSNILTIILPPILEWRVFEGGKLFSFKLKYVRIYLTIIVGLTIMACSFYVMPIKEKMSMHAYVQHFILREEDIQLQSKFVIFLQ